MATSILDNTQGMMVEPITGQGRDNDVIDQARKDSEVRMVQIRQEEQQRLQERQKAEERIQQVQARIRTRQSERQSVEGVEGIQANKGIADLMNATARSAENMRDLNTRGGKTQVFNPTTNTWSVGVRPSRDQASVDVATELKRQMGFSALGARLPTVEGSWKEGERRFGAMAEEQGGIGLIDRVKNFDEPLPPIGANERSAILASPGGETVLREYDTAKSRIADSLTTNIDQFKDKDGLVDPKKVVEFAVKSDDFKPAMAGDIQAMSQRFATQVNQITEDDRKFKLAVDKWNADMVVQNIALKEKGGFGAVAQAVQAGGDKLLEAFPQVGLVQGSMSQQEIVQWVGYQTETNPETRRDALVVTAMREAFGNNVDLTGDTMIANVNGVILSSARTEAQELYQEALRSGEVPQPYILERLAETVKDMKPEEAHFYVKEFAAIVDDVVKADVNTKAERAMGDAVEKAKGSISMMADELGTMARQSRATAFDLGDKKWNDAKTPEAQEEVLRGMFIDKLSAMKDERSANIQGNAEFQAFTQQYDMYLNTLGTGRESALAAQDEVFADLVQLRDLYVEGGKAVIGHRDAVQRGIKEDAAMRNKLVAFDKDDGVHEFNRDAVGMEAFAAFNLADDSRKLEISEKYKEHVSIQAELNGRADKDEAALKGGLVKVELWGSVAGTGQAPTRYGEDYIEPETEDHWDFYMQHLRTEYVGIPERQQKLMAQAIEAKKVWQKETAKDLGLSGADAEEIFKQIGELGQDEGVDFGRRRIGRATKKTLRSIAKSDMQVGPDTQRRIPDAQFQRIADGSLVVERMGAFEPREGYTLMFGEGANGVVIGYVPDEDVEQEKQRGRFTFD